MSTLKKSGVELLWEEFINKIQKEWRKKYADYGTDINNIDSPTKFAQAIYADIEIYFKETRRNVKLINSLTLHRYFMQDGFSPRVKAGTLDLFSMYLGYGMFTDFIKENKRKIVTKTNVSDTLSSRITKKTKRTLVLSAAGILIILIAWGSWKIFLSSGCDDISIEEKQEIENLINDAAELEFQIRHPDTTLVNKLTNYYIADGPGIKTIKAGIEHIIRKNRRLHSSSYYQILSIKCISVSDDEASVETEEKWRLIWYNIETGKEDVGYNVLNKQTYYLKRVNGRWKIYHNEYSGSLEDTANNI